MRQRGHMLRRQMLLSVKTASARWQVPVYSELLRLGLPSSCHWKIGRQTNAGPKLSEVALGSARQRVRCLGF